VVAVAMARPAMAKPVRVGLGRKVARVMENGVVRLPMAHAAARRAMVIVAARRPENVAVPKVVAAPRREIAVKTPRATATARSARKSKSRPRRMRKSQRAAIR